MPATHSPSEEPSILWTPGCTVGPPRPWADEQYTGRAYLRACMWFKWDPCQVVPGWALLGDFDGLWVERIRPEDDPALLPCEVVMLYPRGRIGRQRRGSGKWMLSTLTGPRVSEMTQRWRGGIKDTKTQESLTRQLNSSIVSDGLSKPNQCLV